MMRRLFGLLLALTGCGEVREAPQPPAIVPAAEAPALSREAPVSSRAFGPEIGFRSRRLLTEHVEKHGAEFGGVSTAVYLRLAQQLRDAEPGGDIIEVTRADGTISRFQRSTGAFIAFNADGTIRTFFKPNDGEKYFQRQARRRPSR